MTEPDIVAELDRWLADTHGAWRASGLHDLVQRAHNEIVRLAAEVEELRHKHGWPYEHKETRAIALEEAAKICEGAEAVYGWNSGEAFVCAAAIRALKGNRRE